jgi:kynureninase
MRYEFDPIPGAEGWQLSNPDILSMSAIKASLDIFEEAGFDKIREKSKKLTAFFEFLLKEIEGDLIEIITPELPEERGCQLSIKVKNADKELFDKLTATGVISDWREPNVIRVAPAPLYNSYVDVFEMVQRLKKLI